ncbi:MAG: hypothetical protein J5525_00225 [Lachnospiraceae bacterium]|nr:hypothetical protein [Lachnospiraceae bacterium]
MRARIIIVFSIIGLVVVMIWCALPFVRYAIPVHKTHFTNYEKYCNYASPQFILLKFPEKACDIMYYVGFYRAKEMCGISFSIPEDDYLVYKDQLSSYLELFDDDIFVRDEITDTSLNYSWFQQHGMGNIEQLIRDDDSVDDYKIVDYYTNQRREYVMILANDDIHRFLIIEYDCLGNNQSDKIINP